MMILVKLMFIPLLVFITIYGEMIATTESGKKVILEENGRWHYFTEQKEIVPPSTTDKSRISLVELLKNDTRYDFRKVRWGMGKKEVITTENANLIKNSGDSLVYEMIFLGYNCSVVYTFSKDVLWGAIFLIKQPHVDPALFFKDYDELKKYLTPLYGNAISDKNEWKNEIYKGDKTKWGFAISIGFLTCRTMWKNDRTNIELKINGGNHQITTEIQYTSINK